LRKQFIRGLDIEEISSQVSNIVGFLKLSSNKPLLLSAMGIGEPLCNYTNFIAAIQCLHSLYPQARFAMATTGVKTNHIYDLINDTVGLDFKLTLSLHSAIEANRKWLMPASRDLQSLVDAAEAYQKATNRKIEYNIVLIDGVNDSLKHAEAVYSLLRKRGIAEKTVIKLNRLNPVSISKFEESKHVREFVIFLKSHGLNVERYETNGSDIEAARGQLIGGLPNSAGYFEQNKAIREKLKQSGRIGN